MGCPNKHCLWGCTEKKKKKKQELALVTFLWKLMEPHLPSLDLDNSIFGFLLNGVTTAWRLIAKLVVPDLACNAGNHKRTWRKSQNFCLEPEDGIVKSPLPVSSKTTLGVASLHAWQRTATTTSHEPLLAIFHEVEQIFHNFSVGLVGRDENSLAKTSSSFQCDGCRYSLGDRASTSSWSDKSYLNHPTFGDTKPSSGGYRSFRTKLCTGRFNCGFRRCSYDIQLHTGLTHGYFSALSWYQLKPKTGDITLHSCFLVHLLTLCHTTEGCQNSKVDCLLRTLTSPSGHLWWLPIFRKNATCHLPVPLWYLHLQVLDRVEDPQPPAIWVCQTSNVCKS